MINKLEHLHTALYHLPAISNKSQATLKAPHWVVDYNTARNIRELGVRHNINTHITTALDSRNSKVTRPCRAYHVFRIDGDRPLHPNLGKKRAYVKRPRPQVQVIASIPKEYRRHNGGH